MTLKNALKILGESLKSDPNDPAYNLNAYSEAFELVSKLAKLGEKTLVEKKKEKGIRSTQFFDSVSPSKGAK